jgi:hypothetical protein
MAQVHPEVEIAYVPRNEWPKSVVEKMDAALGRTPPDRITQARKQAEELLQKVTT